MTWAVWLLGPVLALVLLPSNVVATALPLLRAEWSASATEMGWVFAAYQVGYVAAVLLVLPLTDRVSAGRVIAACSLAAALAYLLFPLLAHDVWSASALRILSGASLAGVYMPGVRVVARSAQPERRGLAVSLYVSAFYVGSALSLGATGFLLETTDWRGAALVLALLSLAAVPPAVWAARRAGPAGEAPTRGPGGFLGIQPRVLAHGPLLRTVLAYAGHSWELYVARGWMAAFFAAVLASAHGLSTAESAAEAGKWAAISAGLGTAGVWLGGWLSDRWGRPRAALLMAAASGGISLAFGWLGGLGWGALVLVGCLYGLVMAADSGVYSTAVTELAPPGQIGSAQAAQAFIGFLASAVAPVAAGVMLDLGGGYGAVFVLAGLASLGGALALLPLARAGVASQREPVPARS